MKILKRILGLPFVVALIAISAIYLFIENTCYFIRYGGEMFTYKQKDEPESRRGILNEITNFKTDNK